MLHHVHKMLDAQSAMYTHGEFGAAARYFATPLPLHTKNELKVHHSTEEIEEALRCLVSVYQENGVQQVQWTITAVDIPRNGQFRVWTTWDHVLTDRVIESASHVTFYCRLEQDQIMAEMVHFVRTPLDAEGSEPALYLRRA